MKPSCPPDLRSPNSNSNRVLLIYLPMDDPGYIMADRTDYRMKRVPLLGLQYLMAVLKNAGFRVQLLDGSSEPVNADRIIAEHRRDPLLFAGFYAHHYIKETLRSTLAYVRRQCPDLTTVIGGPGYFEYESYLRASADFVCHGEGERTIEQLARFLKGEFPAEGLRGISYLDRQGVVTAPRQPLIAELDSLPFPDRTAYPIADYHDYHVVGLRTPYTTMITSRGCPFHCAFCTTHDIWGSIRRRSVANVLAEIDQLVRQHGIRYIGFKDDLFGSQKQWVEEFIAGLRERRYDLRFNCMISPRSFGWDPEGVLRALCEVGLDMIIPGLQSATPSILSRIGRKPTDPEHLSRLVGIAKRLEITTVVEFIIGLPGETVLSAHHDLNFALAIRPHYALFFRLAVLEGSQLAQEFADHPTCDLSNAQIKQLVDSFSRMYFSNAAVLSQFIFHVLRKNPRWFLKIIPYAFYLLRAIGMVKKKVGGREA